MHVLLSLSSVMFKADVFLLILCLGDLSVDIIEVLKSPIIIVSISPFRRNIYFIYFGAFRLGAYIFITVISSC